GVAGFGPPPPHVLWGGPPTPRSSRFSPSISISPAATSASSPATSRATRESQSPVSTPRLSRRSYSTKRLTVDGSRFTVHGSRFRVHGSGFTVQGSPPLMH